MPPSCRFSSPVSPKPRRYTICMPRGPLRVRWTAARELAERAPLRRARLDLLHIVREEADVVEALGAKCLPVLSRLEDAEARVPVGQGDVARAAARPPLEGAHAE